MRIKLLLEKTQDETSTSNFVFTSLSWMICQSNHTILGHTVASSVVIHYERKIIFFQYADSFSKNCQFWLHQLRKFRKKIIRSKSTPKHVFCFHNPAKKLSLEIQKLFAQSPKLFSPQCSGLVHFSIDNHAENFSLSPKKILFFSHLKFPKRFLPTRWIQFWQPCRKFFAQSPKLLRAKSIFPKMSRPRRMEF